ncbi:MAG: PLP-dependent transferase [Chloroflexi bacterium]|nr:PLP-dependent transferase [Chloroflexota bacterium]
MNLSKAGFSTKAVHAGEQPDELTGAVPSPIYQNSTFAFKSADHAARVFQGQEQGYAYSRLGNPTNRSLEEKLGLLEGGVDAVVTASGMAAVSTLVGSLVRADDHILAAGALYSATYTFLDQLAPRMGLAVSFADATKVSEFRSGMRASTRMIYIETPANPTMDVVDIAAVAELARSIGALLVVDNTFATFYNQRPLQLGANLVLHSATKYIGGHSDVVAGAIIGSQEHIGLIRSTLKVTGGILGPFEAWLLLRGLRTLPLRVARQNETAQRVAEFLQERPEVARVLYPGLPSHSGHAIAKRQMSGYGGVLSFELKGGVEAGRTLMNSVELCTLAVSLGSVETLIEHPASMTHAGVPPAARQKAGITDGLVRLAVGIEDAEDIIEDLRQALERTNRTIAGRIGAGLT